LKEYSYKTTVLQDIGHLAYDDKLKYLGLIRLDRRRIRQMPLFYWVATLSKLFTHIASTVFSAPRNWGTKGSIRTGPI